MDWKEHFRQLIVSSFPSHPLPSAYICVCIKRRYRRFIILFPRAPGMLTNHRMRFVSHLISLSCSTAIGLPGGSSGKDPDCQCRGYKRHGFHPWVGKIPWRRAWQPSSLSLPGESHEQRSLAGHSPWGHKESDTTEVT